MIYLCGLCQNNQEDVDDLTLNTYRYFDGLIFTDGGSTDDTVKILNERKKAGEILHRKWSNDHDLQSNIWLRSGTLKFGDWFLIRDTSERLSPEFCDGLKNTVENLEKENINSCWWQSKGFLFKFFGDELFYGSPHWGIQNVKGNSVDLSERYPDPDSQTWNTRISTRSDEYWAKHHMKYIWTYDRSNHLLLGREDNIREYEKLESERRQLRFTLFKLGFNPSLESFNRYLDSHENYNPALYDICLRNPYIKKYIDLISP